MTAVLSPTPKFKGFDNNGAPAANYRLFTYAAGTSTKLATKVSANGSDNSNPITLDYRGEADVWTPPNVAYKYVFAPPGSDDPPTAPIWTVDGIESAQLITLYGGVDTGIVNAYVLTFDANFSAYADGIVIYWIPSHSNTGASTINVNGLGVVSIKNQNDTELSAGQLTAGEVSQIMYYNGAFRNLSPSIASQRNHFTAGNSDAWVTATDGATTTIDCALGNVFAWTIGGNRTMAFDNEVDGSWVELYITQDATGGRVWTLPANMVWAGGAAPDLSTTATVTDRMFARYKLADDTWYAIFTPNFSDGATAIIITQNQTDVDVFALASEPGAATTVTVLIATGVVIEASSPITPALNFAGFAASTVIDITNAGYVLGHGGEGGDGGCAAGLSGNDPYGELGRAGEDGGTAIKLPSTACTITIDNGSGFIWGGGGGGGGGGGTSSTSSGNLAVGGGGGGGAGAGRRGQGKSISSQNGASATAANGISGGNGPRGDFGAGGLGADRNTADGGDGGAGGTWGAAGTAGTSPTAQSFDTAGGAAGAAGKAVNVNGGTAPTFSSGSGSPHVKGAVS